MGMEFRMRSAECAFKHTPAELPLSLRCGLDAMVLQNVRDCAGRNGVSDVAQGPFDSFVTPTRIFTGHPENKIDDFLVGAGAASLAFRALVTVSLDQFAMPPTERVGLDDDAGFLQILFFESPFP